MEVIQNIKIDLLQPGVKPVANVMQADQNSRSLEIALFANGVAWLIPDGVSFSMAYKKPDGTKGLYDTLPDGSSASSVDGNVVYIRLAPQMLTVPGTVTATVVISAGDQRINTFPIIVNVIQNPAVGAVGSEDYYYSVVIGNLDDLKTENKSSLVAAINEIFSTGTAGGYYTPVVTQPTTNTMKTAFVPSVATMPAVEPVTITLPVGPDSSQNVNQYTFLNGLKYYALGDSIVDMQGTLTAPETFGDTGYSTDLQSRDISGITVEGYVTAIERRYGLVATNYGKGGHTLVGDYSTLASMNYSDVALVTIAYGVNDARTGVPLGTVNSTDATTFAGALNNLLRKIYTDNPECRVLILAPLQRLYVSDFGIATPNANGNYLIDFVDMCKAVAEKRSTKCIDMYRGCGINQTNLYYYTVEGVHPVNQGFARMKGAIVPVLDDMFAVEFEPFGTMTNTGDTEPDEPETGGGTGGGSGGEEPPEEDAGATTVELTADMFTMDGLYIDGSGTIQQKADARSNASPIELIPGKTYTLVTYLSNRYSDTKAYFGTLATNADFPTTTGGNGLRTDRIGASFEDNAAMLGNVNHAKITYTWVAAESSKYLFVGTTKLSDELMIKLSYV